MLRRERPAQWRHDARERWPSVLLLVSATEIEDAPPVRSAQPPDGDEDAPQRSPAPR